MRHVPAHMGPLTTWQRARSRIAAICAVIALGIGIAVPAFAQTIRIQRGDTLSALALKYHTTVHALAVRNHIPNVNLIYAGATLIVPSGHTHGIVRTTRHVVRIKPIVYSAPVRSVGFGIWDCIAYHESGGNWSINTGNGYYGGLQFLESTWLGYGGGAYAAYANEATPAQQVAIAQRVLASQGWNAWPQTSRMCGV